MISRWETFLENQKLPYFQKKNLHWMNPICLKGKKKKLGDQVTNLSPPALFCWSDQRRWWWGRRGKGGCPEGQRDGSGACCPHCVCPLGWQPSQVFRPGWRWPPALTALVTGAQEHVTLNRSPGTSEVNRRCLFHHVPRMPLQFIPRLEWQRKHSQSFLLGPKA